MTMLVQSAKQSPLSPPPSFAATAHCISPTQSTNYCLLSPRRTMGQAPSGVSFSGGYCGPIGPYPPGAVGTGGCVNKSTDGTVTYSSCFETPFFRVCPGDNGSVTTCIGPSTGPNTCVTTNGKHLESTSFCVSLGVGGVASTHGCITKDLR